MPFLKDSLFLIRCCRNERSCTQFPGLRSWERAPAWSLRLLPPVTSLKRDLLSYAPLTQDMQCFLALWRLLFAWLCFCSVFLLPKVASYEDIETRISANKAPLFHLRLGSPVSLYSSTPIPRSGSTKTVMPHSPLQPGFLIQITGCRKLFDYFLNSPKDVHN